MKIIKWTLAIISLVVLALIVVTVLLGSSINSRRATNSQAQVYEIEYRITGTTRSVSVTYENETGGTEQQSEARVPFSMEFTAIPGKFLYISAQNNNDRGNVTCEILVNGIVVKTATSNGAYVIATCSGRL